MGFKVDYGALDTMFQNVNGRISAWRTELDQMSVATAALTETTNMTGEGAESVRLYMTCVHNLTQQMIVELLQMYYSNCIKYKSEYLLSIDTDDHAVIEEKILVRKYDDYTATKRRAKALDEEVRYTLRRVTDIWSFNMVSGEGVLESHQSGIDHIKNLQDSITTLEATHTANDFINIDEMISNLRTLIQEHLAFPRGYKNNFSTGNIQNSESFRKVYETHLAIEKEYLDNADLINQAIEAENKHISVLQAEYEQRVKDAERAKWIVAGVCAIGSVVAVAAIVASGGTATPLVVGAISGVSGAVMGAANYTADHYVEYGTLDNMSLAGLTGAAAWGGITGFVTGYAGAHLSGAVTAGLGKTTIGSAMLNSSNTVARVGAGVVIGSASEVTSGVVTRAAGTLMSGDGLEAAVESAFDGEQIFVDALIGGATGGMGEYQRAKSINWEYTSNTEEELALIREMDEGGEFDFVDSKGKTVDYGPVDVDPDAPLPTDPKSRLPTGKKGEIIGDRDSGTFEYIPDDSKTKSTMAKYGEETIKYKNNDPDFKPYTKHDTPWGETDCEVKIGYMSGARTGSGSNYNQADAALAEKISAETGKPITAGDVKNYRENNGLTWHELVDRETMQLVPTEINATSPHVGGVSQSKYEMSWGDQALDLGDNSPIKPFELQPTTGEQVADGVNTMNDTMSDVKRIVSQKMSYANKEYTTVVSGDQSDEPVTELFAKIFGF